MDILAHLQLLPQKEVENILNNVNITYEDFAQLAKENVTRGLAQYTTYEIHDFLQTYLPPVLLTLGAVGNILSFCVFRKYSRKSPAYVYLTALSVMDIVVLFVGLLRVWVNKITSIDIQNTSDILCKLMTFLCYVSSDSSAWMIVVLTVSRYNAVRNPLRAKNSCYRNRSRWFISGIVSIICITNVHFFWTVERTTTDSGNKCQASKIHTVFVNKILPWIDSAIYSFLPGFFICCINCRMIKEIHDGNIKREKMRKRSEISVGKKMSKNKQLTVLLLVVSFAFVFTTMPFNIILIITASFNSEAQHISSLAHFMLTRTVAELFMYFNHSANFVLYCTIGSQFRAQLRSVFCKSKDLSRNLSLEPNKGKPRHSVEMTSLPVTY